MNALSHATLTAPGIYTDFPTADYFADPTPTPSLSQSIAKVLIDRSPKHAWCQHPRLGASEQDDTEQPTSAQVIGDAAHMMMIGRGKKIAVAEFADWRTKAAQEFRAEAQSIGNIAILAKHYARAEAMVKAARQQIDDAGHDKAFREGQGEVAIVAQEGDVWLRALVDWMVTPTLLHDYKTSAMSCAPHVIAERPSMMGWDVQGAMQERILDILDPANAGRRKFLFVAQENQPPYALTVVRLSEHDLTMGRKKLDYAVPIWAECLATGQWPSYSTETVISQPKQWLESKWLEREEHAADRRQSGPFMPTPFNTTGILAG